MNQGTKDRAKGSVRELKGKIKTKIGGVTKNRRLQAEGIGDQVAGKLQKKLGEVEQALDKRRTG
jgi:uncharacterized protein YjbJ (UPF0337 family)